MTKAEAIAAEAVQYSANIEAKRLSINLFTAILVLTVVGGGIFALSQERSRIDTAISGNRNHIDTKIAQVLTAVESLKASVEFTQKRTEDRFTRKDSEVQCLKMALLNPGLNCPNPNGPQSSYYMAEADNWQRSTHTKKAGRLR